MTITVTSDESTKNIPQQHKVVIGAGSVDTYALLATAQAGEYLFLEGLVGTHIPAGTITFSFSPSSIDAEASGAVEYPMEFDTNTIFVKGASRNIRDEYILKTKPGESIWVKSSVAVTLFIHTSKDREAVRP